MKKLSSITCILTFLYLLLPVTVLTAGFLGYDVVFNPLFLSLFTSLISLFFTVIICVKKICSANKAEKVVFFSLPILAVVNLFFYIPFNDEPFVLISIIANIICSVILLFKFIPSMAVRFTDVGICAGLFILYLWALMIVSLFSGIAVETPVKTIPSPNEEYSAVVISRDEGALGGSTYVEICQNNSEIRIFPFKFQKRPNRIYAGDYGTHENLVIYWKDNNCVVISGKEYKNDDCFK